MRRWMAMMMGLAMGLGAAAAHAEQPMRIGVMSFNIRYGTADDGPNSWPHRRDAVFDLIRESGADFIGVQEALPFQIDELRAVLPGYGHLGRTREPDPEKGEASPIFYRRQRWRPDEAERGTFWLSDTPAVPGSAHWGNRFPRIVTWARFVEQATGRAVYIYNTHFDHESQPSRENSAALLAERIAARRHPEPVIVTGDFNAGEDNPAIARLKGETEPDASPLKLLDTFRRVHPDAERVGTYHAWRDHLDGEKIDYIFMEPDATVLDAAILRDRPGGRYPSDHFPVSATVELPAGRF